MAGWVRPRKRRLPPQAESAFVMRGSEDRLGGAERLGEQAHAVLLEQPACVRDRRRRLGGKGERTAGLRVECRRAFELGQTLAIPARIVGERTHPLQGALQVAGKMTQSIEAGARDESGVDEPAELCFHVRRVQPAASMAFCDFTARSTSRCSVRMRAVRETAWNSSSTTADDRALRTAAKLLGRADTARGDARHHRVRDGDARILDERFRGRVG